MPWDNAIDVIGSTKIIVVFHSCTENIIICKTP